MLKNHIQLAEGFQYSANIAYDLFRDDKIQNFIPTSASITLIEDLLLSTYPSSAERARVLIGAYGKGKSHIVLVLLSMLLRKDKMIFKDVLAKIKEYSKPLYDYVSDYINSDHKLLPVIIQGSTASLSQSFLGSLEKALDDHSLKNIMPDTHFKSALQMIENWSADYPETYQKMQQAITEPISDFKVKLENYEPLAYETFAEVYPSLTSGGIFNPFYGFDVVELYSNVVERLKEHGYNGVFVVYDEFSKFLEAGIQKVSSVDIKLLQDFAEKCNRSGENQMHLLLISHKDISNYIDKLPKTKVDGWKGVSERFKHVELRNNFSQVYEIIGTVIKKDDAFFKDFFKKYNRLFVDMIKRLNDVRIFEDVNADDALSILKGCYPLSAFSTFILPRLSEKAAQNERTLFTFLSSNNKNTLHSFLETASGDFPLLTPDYIYDYFEPQFKKEQYTTDTYQTWQMTQKILNKISNDELGCKIIKTIALIYILGQFEKLPPVRDVVVEIFRDVYDVNRIDDTIKDLEKNKYVIYQRKTNRYLKLKDTTGINIGEMLDNQKEKERESGKVKDILNQFSFDNYMYPTSYNDDNEITRYFDFVFIESSEFLDVKNWNKKIEDYKGDGVVFGIITKDKADTEVIRTLLESESDKHDRIVFVLSTQEFDIDENAYLYSAIKTIWNSHLDDDVFLAELSVYLEDMENYLNNFIISYTKPETQQSLYFYNGKRQAVNRKAQLSALLSDICNKTFPDTPIINNEAINKNNISSITTRSRDKIVDGLLANVIEENLGLIGTGQEVSIMRNTILNMGLLDNKKKQLILKGNSDAKIQNVIDVIENFFKESSLGNEADFDKLYNHLTKPEHKIGLKRGVIPLYIAVVLHHFKEHAVISRNGREIEITSQLLNEINDNPAEYSLYLENWTEEKSEYIAGLEKLFADHIIDKEREYNTFNYIVRAMQRWFISLPKYSKELKEIYKGNEKTSKLPAEKLRFINSLKLAELNAREYLFDEIFGIFGYEDIRISVVDNIENVKTTLDKSKRDLIGCLVKDIKEIFINGQPNGVTLASVVRDWYEHLPTNAQNHLYNNGEERILEMFANPTNDEVHFVERLAKAVIGLRIDDWESSQIKTFLDDLRKFKEVVEGIEQEQKDNPNSFSYKIAFVDSEGQEQTKTFAKTKLPEKAELLENDILSSLDEFGVLTENEKRQVLIEILERLCV